MKKLILFFLIFATGITVHSQYVVNYKKVADAYFQSKDYYAASTFYKKALKITSDSSQIVLPYGKDNKQSRDVKIIEDYENSLYNLAESSRLYRNFSEAEKYYEVARTFKDPKYEKALFYYAESLRANKKFQRAIAALEQYKERSKNEELIKKANLEILSCTFAMQEMRYPRLVQIKKMPAQVNALGSNYAAVAEGSDLYFTSSRPVPVAGKSNVIKVNGEALVSTKANPFINTLYKTKNNNTETLKEVKMLDLPKDMEFAAASFNPAGNIVYFTGWQNKDKYAIYVATKTDDKWSEPKALGLQINSKDFNTAQPFVSADGKFLLFSSDRPGGYGKYDLWYAAIRADGSMSQPINLGPDINSESDEKAPNYNVLTKKLIFSTDGRIGFGGFDFFESEGDLITWTTPKNMGYPFNSSKDDIYFSALDVNGNRGYISSDRESSCCLEIFEVVREYISISGTITDCKTGKSLEGVSVKITDQETEYNLLTDQSGRYLYKTDSRRPLKLYISKENYFAVNKNYGYAEIARADTLLNADDCLKSFKINVPIVLDNIYYEFNSAALSDSSKKVLDILVKILNDNPEIEIELSAHTDDVGTDSYNQDLSEKRAKSCVDYLISQGVSTDRIVSKGYGKSLPIAPNRLKNGKDNPEGRAKNRRTEFKVTKK